LTHQLALARRLRRENYGTALIMPRTWKSVLAPFLAGIPERTGFVGEARYFLLNDLRHGERRLPRMVDRCAASAYAALTRRLIAEGLNVWVIGGPEEKALAGEIIADTTARDLTENDL